MTTKPPCDPGRKETLTIRLPGNARALIDRAAEAGGKTRTAFILEAARREAEDVLLDRAEFTVGAEAYAAFLAQLDAPAQPNERLGATMQTPQPWTTG